MKTLLKLVEEENIALRYETLPPSLHSLGIYDNDGYRKRIILHKILKDYPRLLRCILSEELGHHFTSAGKPFYQAANCQFWRLNHIKTELKALKWSAFYLIPEDRLCEAIEKEKLYHVYELEEYFNVTRELMLFRLRHRKDINFLCLNSLIIEEDKYLSEVLGNQ